MYIQSTELNTYDQIQYHLSQLSSAIKQNILNTLYNKGYKAGDKAAESYENDIRYLKIENWGGEEDHVLYSKDSWFADEWSDTESAYCLDEASGVSELMDVWNAAIHVIPKPTV